MTTSDKVVTRVIAHLPLRRQAPTALQAMKIRYAAKTDVGMKRTHNEDYFSLIEDEQLFIVADGMGGHAIGRGRLEDGGRDDRRVLPAHARGRRRDLALQDGPLALVHREPAGLRHQARQPPHLRDLDRDLRYKGMGTTIVVDAWSRATRSTSATSATRASIASATAGSQQLTRDHSLLEDYKEAKPDMTEEEERNFPHKNVITRALGMRETVQVDIRSHQIKSGDVYILCSDGLSGMVADEQIARSSRRRAASSSARSPSSSTRRTATAAPTTSPSSC